MSLNLQAESYPRNPRIALSLEALQCSPYQVTQSYSTHRFTRRSDSAGGWGQTPFSGAQQQDKGQWAQTEA